MAKPAELILDLVDVYGDPIDDRVDARLKHRVLRTASYRLKGESAGETLRFKGLDATQGGVYHLTLFTLRHRPVGRILRLREGRATTEHLVLPVNPAVVEGIAAPPYARLPAELKRVLQASSVEGQPGLSGAPLYGALDDARKAGLLNLHAKLDATRFASGRSVLSFFNALTRVRGDRIFARVARELRDETKSAVAQNLFAAAGEGLHTPPPGFKHAGSFKTRDGYGNLQLTFFADPATLEFVVDADIDDAQGVGHVFQVLDHALGGGATSPYDIHEVLLHHQKLDPGYRLVV